MPSAAGRIVFVICLSSLLSSSQALLIKTCNCSNPILRGTLDVSDPPYCSKNQRVTHPINATYGVITKPKLANVWEGYSCTSWIKEKQISTFLLLSTDTVFKEAPRAVSEAECWGMVRQPNKCGPNQMIRDGTSWYFKRQPEGLGKWLTTQHYSVMNCFSQTIKLSQACPTCPIITPFGALKNVTNNRSARINDITIVWDERLHVTDSTCEPKNIFQGEGALTIADDKKHAILVDMNAQLEFHITLNKTMLCPKHERVFPIIGLPDTYIHLHLIEARNRFEIELLSDEFIPSDENVRLSGRVASEADERYCLLTYNGVLGIRFCSVTDAPGFSTEFEYSSNGLLKKLNSSMCVHLSHAKHNGLILISCNDDEITETFPTRWNYDLTNRTLTSSPDKYCISAWLTNVTVHAEPRQKCDPSKSRNKWNFQFNHVGPLEMAGSETEIIRPIKTKKKKKLVAESQVLSFELFNNMTVTQVGNLTDEHKTYLMTLHRNFYEGLQTSHANALANEIRQVYCQITSLRRNQAIILSQINGLLAARALNLKTCERLTGEGQVVFLQQCQMVPVEISAKRTRCGSNSVFQPLYISPENRNYTLGKDGWSLHAWSECFWNSPVININSKSYSFVDDDWQEEEPNIHSMHLELIQYFKEIPANDFEFLPKHQNFFEMHNLESLNVIAELIGRIQNTNSESLSDLVLSQQSNNHLWDTTTWITILKYGLLAVGCIIVLTIIAKLFTIFNPIPSLRKFFESCKIKKKKAAKIPIETMTPMLPKTTSPSTLAPNHDHSRTIYIEGQGLFFIDGCPSIPFTK